MRKGLATRGHWRDQVSNILTRFSTRATYVANTNIVDFQLSRITSTLSLPNRPFHGVRPPFCWVGKEIKERLPNPIQILLKSAHGAESTVRFRRFLQVCVSKRYRSLEPIEVSVFSSRLVNISSIRWKSGQLWTKTAHLDSHVRSLSVAIFGTIVISLTICINVLPVPFPWVKLFAWPFWTFLLPPFRFKFKSSLCVHAHDLPWLYISPCGSVPSTGDWCESIFREPASNWMYSDL